ncbi:hypothetical protein J0A68_18240 [Algoriphagus sp. H41]|uniref:Glycosyl transferase family 2 n=1 Tax=Algoriphagus oliviformis TaxID=2811231 RepID=A0ABS3C6Z8_9BACT|nr:glycosyltransferase family 2 protein [Algoriphagus oliviformis]MBN7812902.1 hypothetical protein [Algoriphagus oliviformis]
MRILFFSSVCKSLEIFQVASESYLKLNREGFELDYLFLDDNRDPRTKEYLAKLVAEREDASFLDFQMDTQTEYTNHDWDSKKIDRIIAIKNAAIREALSGGYDYLFLVDSDLVLHPDTLASLVEAGKDFIFSIFWTKFREDSPYTPNAWDFHSWNYHSEDSYYRLKEPGVFEVGGGGACTLLSRELLEKGLNFNRLSSMNFQGEDRHFCTRAQALGYGLFVDSRLPCYHIFQDEMAPEAAAWYAQGARRDFFDRWLDAQWRQEVKRRFEYDPRFSVRVKKFLYEVRNSFSNHFLA